MERLDRRAVVLIVVALMLGFVAWQVVSSLGYLFGELLVDWWEDDSTTGAFGAEFSIGGVDVEYGQLLSSTITLLLALLAAVPLLRYATRRRAAS